MRFRLLSIPRTAWGTTLSSRQSASRKSRTLYDILEVTPQASANEIKAAYYRLSMKYHPDKNRGSDTSNQRFQEITVAYDTLSSEALRTKYDEETIGTRSPLRQSRGPTTDWQRPGKKPIMKGRTPIYNFDEFYRQHYGDAVKSYQERKAQYEEGVREAAREKPDSVFYVNVMLLFMVFLIAFEAWHNGHDVPSAPPPDGGATNTGKDR
ncbi:dnaJ homolog subfamily C member 30, mitochondrial [Ixodes scapularis]|uniref:dnaJ homolog subfamily C member 30, mitochondrial n=1 Tax=Ixodes scapularis TaxID=6945 RepID=UPI001C390444|nr:dnaJ homolog subfamily C member 30, mitochondrial [Ixodes scapularis]